jgi:hypothetical protein
MRPTLGCPSSSTPWSSPPPTAALCVDGGRLCVVETSGRARLFDVADPAKPGPDRCDHGPGGPDRGNPGRAASVPQRRCRAVDLGCDRSGPRPARRQPDRLPPRAGSGRRRRSHAGAGQRRPPAGHRRSHPARVAGYLWQGNERDGRGPAARERFCLAEGGGALRVFGRGNSHLAPVGAGVSFGVRAIQLALDGPLAYVSAADNTLRVVDISAPQTPLEIGRVDLPYAVAHLAVADGYLYTAAGAAGLQVFTLAQPAQPSRGRRRAPCRTTPAPWRLPATWPSSWWMAAG